MLSEWLEDLPDNFAEDWVYCPVPMGHRALLVARKASFAHALVFCSLSHEFCNMQSTQSVAFQIAFWGRLSLIRVEMNE